MDNPSTSSGELTALLARWSSGDQDALNQIFPLVYRDLRRLAASHLRLERQGHSLQATALVHESYLRMLGREEAAVETRAQFFSAASQVVRRVLVDHARKRKRLKRGGGALIRVLDESLDAANAQGLDVIRLDDALAALAKMDSRMSRIVEMRFFGGLQLEEIAKVLKISARTVAREWRDARAWLLCQMESSSREDGK